MLAGTELPDHISSDPGATPIDLRIDRYCPV
jgi:hypothetical protein